ncbi:MAG: branched-chain amino acid transaminase [Acidimicrobiia bacterium]
MEPTKTIWSDGEMVPWEAATVHVLSHALHYGTAVFEGIRAYKTPVGTAVFRLGDHMARLQRSAAAYGIPMLWSPEQLCEAVKDLIRGNELDDAYVRPIVFFGEGVMGLNPAGAKVRTMIATWEWGAYLGEEGMQNGIRVAVSSWRRIDGESLIPGAKGAGAYINSVLAKTEAIRAGVDEALMLGSSGHVSEGSGENLFLVRDGLAFTPPPAMGALAGITRDSVMRLLADAGNEVEERIVARSDLYAADEAFFTGTAAEVTPIREIDGRPVGDGRPAPVTRKAQEAFMAVVHGETPDLYGWLDPI